MSGWKTYTGIIITTISGIATAYLSTHPEYVWAKPALDAAISGIISGLGLTGVGVVHKVVKQIDANNERQNKFDNALSSAVNNYTETIDKEEEE